MVFTCPGLYAIESVQSLTADVTEIRQSRPENVGFALRGLAAKRLHVMQGVECLSTIVASSSD
jgi:hypothetical protein